MNLKKIWILVFVIFLGSSQGPNAPSSATNDNSGGADAWINPNNAKIEDGTLSVVTFSDVGLTSNWLSVSNFGFSVPVGSTIDGLVLEWKAKGSQGDLDFPSNAVQSIIKSGTHGSEQIPPLATYPDAGVTIGVVDGVLRFYSAGGPTDKWHQSWSVSEINSSALSSGSIMSDGSDIDVTGSTASIDAIRLTVYYTTAAGVAQRQISFGGDKGGIVGVTIQTLGKDGWH